MTSVELTAEIDRATARLLATARDLDPGELRAPSRCAGWSRAHVLTHVARNADSLVNLLTWARTGVETPQYASAEARAADIESGARRAPGELVDDLAVSAERFAAAVAAMPADRWDAQVRTMSGVARAAHELPVARLRELEVHHVDLDAGYRAADWPTAFVDRELPLALALMSGRVPGLRRDPAGAVEVAATVVRGSPAHLLAWLYGRPEPGTLDVDPPGPPPELPDWG